ncbi:oxidoreductase [Croceicoccus estronivorus]|uniref:SDR family oxidoreductase n=1 Tax=Croceicoccus estronivorus TaxID=1172626 RepID=UPI000835A060|nr:SDR family oxidoreductase [Croceicoccus estronivorus]OCC25516.1 oxidoreductase [Croceicoccus estronivorus]
MLLKDKVVVVNGVGPGMGQAIARIAGAEGAKVVLSARNKAFIEQVRDEIIAAGGQAVAVPCDIGDADQCKALAQAAADAFSGRIDGLVNSAFYHGDWSFVENADEEDWSKIFDVNCLGTLRMTKACVPFLKDGGAVVNVSTMATMRPYGTEHGMEMGYAVSKGGINVLSKYMASDLGRYGIRVNTCRMGWIHGAPVQGYIDSEVAKGRSEAEVIGEVTHDIPLGKIPPQDDCARAVLMMISDFAAVVTGAALDVNGGHWIAP